ncbi:SPOR domain-containing protein, partial [bacterium]|nr:SPOR domain-containing protein [bacterium]
MSRVKLLSFFIFLLFVSCATPYRVTVPVASGDRYFLPITWYGSAFHGKKTASGEKFDKNAMSCAAYGFPFGTCLKITNPQNGKSVIVKVTDRPGKAVVDMSKASFLKIAKTSVGRFYGRVVVVSACGNSVSSSVTPVEKPVEQKRFTIEVARFDDLEEAGQFLDALHLKDGYIFSPKHGEAVYSVRVSSFDSREDAKAFIEKEL